MEDSLASGGGVGCTVLAGAHHLNISFHQNSSAQLRLLQFTLAMEVLPTARSPMMTMLALWMELSSSGSFSSCTAGTRLKEARSWIPEAGTTKLDWI